MLEHSGYHGGFSAPPGDDPARLAKRQCGHRLQRGEGSSALVAGCDHRSCNKPNQHDDISELQGQRGRFPTCNRHGRIARQCALQLLLGERTLRRQGRDRIMGNRRPWRASRTHLKPSIYGWPTMYRPGANIADKGTMRTHTQCWDGDTELSARRQCLFCAWCCDLQDNQSDYSERKCRAVVNIGPLETCASALCHPHPLHYRAKLNI